VLDKNYTGIRQGIDKYQTFVRKVIYKY
jgi:hypothetical protein